MDSKLNDMIDRSVNVKLKDSEFWYSYKNQKILKYSFASNLLFHSDIDVDEALRITEEFHNKFYEQVLNFKG